ncbi:MAG: hypothetical protein U9P49_05430 [Thermodesulfobacteriota bacterium]|nr:hypothetical protein [Thermodesulfobacteriota bacterium]
MEEKKNKSSTAPIILAVVVFIIGLGLGYFLWGVNREKAPDYKNMLKETIDYIATIEHKNRQTIQKVDALENEIAMLQKEKVASEVSEETEVKIKEMEKEIQVLQEENASLKSSTTTQKEILQQNRMLKATIQQLTEELTSMNARMGAVQELVEPQTTIGTSEIPPGLK